MIGWILGLIYSIIMSSLIGYLGGSVIVDEALNTVLYLLFMMVFFYLFIATTMSRIVYPTKRHTFFKYF